jgi:hypothetical protein
MGASEFPPDLYKIALTANGKLIKRDYNPKRSVEIEHYEFYNATDAKYVSYFWELTLNDSRPPEGGHMVLMEKHADPKHIKFSFGSCACCWKHGLRDFTDPQRTPHPFRVLRDFNDPEGPRHSSLIGLDDPDLPRLGSCGCVCCNHCVRQVEMHPSNLSEESVHCPYCAHPYSFTKNLRVWVVSKQVQECHDKEMELNEILMMPSNL